MTNFNKVMAFCSIAGLQLSAMAMAPSVVSPDYGFFKSRQSVSAPQKVSAFASSAKKSGMKVSAFAGDGNAEVDKLGELVLVDQEDFSLLTTGSEENPDLSVSLEISQWLLDENGNILRDEDGNPIENPEYEYPWNNMKPEFISGKGGWGVGNAFPAGGMLYFPFSQDSPQGKINTPWLDLSAYDGTFVLEFKVKVTEEALKNPMMPAMIIAETAETNNMSPTWDMFEESFMDFMNLSTEWTTFRLVFQGAGKSTLCNIVGQGLSGGMYIDDVKVYSLKPNLRTPQMKRHTDFKEDSFVINWNPVDGADKYLVNVWYDDLYGERDFIAENVEVEGTSFKVEGTNLDDEYFYTVTAVNSEHKSLTPLPRNVFDIVAPEMREAKLVDADMDLYEGGVEPVISAFGYNYFAMARRMAEADGKFIVTNETFTDWTHPLYQEGEEYTKENPADDKITSLYFPTDINQQGWYGQNFQIYKDYICLVPFFYEASYHQDQSAWISPEFDLSKDNGKISVSMKLAAAYDINFENYAYCIVGLYNWNEEKGDYDQVELAYCQDLNFDWQERKVEFTKGSSRSKIAFFGVGSYGDLYIDDIVISQNYKKGEYFDDPFFFSTWQLAENMIDETSFEFDVPRFALGNEIYQKAQAVRMHTNAAGEYDSEAVSPFSDTDFVAKTVSGVNLIHNDLQALVSVVESTILINNPDGCNVMVSTPDGKHVQLGNAASLSHTPAARGMYIVTVGESSIKLAL